MNYPKLLCVIPSFYMGKRWENEWESFQDFLKWLMLNKPLAI